MEEKNFTLIKSYKLLIVWFIGFIVGTVFLSYVMSLLKISGDYLALIWLNLTNLFVISLFQMIYKTERVYYINYVTYKEACEATREERKAFAYKHINVFSKASLIFLIYSAISLIVKINIGINIGVYTVLIVVAAIRTVPFRLKEKNKY
ncbi:MAG: hypothetical protein JXR88_02710 [Clostridia bacterium]|nr:hypothetical protein [Clostridia bacterium]